MSSFKRLVENSEFEEDKHKRANDGKFSKKSGGGGSSNKSSFFSRTREKVSNWNANRKENNRVKWGKKNRFLQDYVIDQIVGGFAGDSTGVTAYSFEEIAPSYKLTPEEMMDRIRDHKDYTLLKGPKSYLIVKRTGPDSLQDKKYVKYLLDANKRAERPWENK